MPDLDQQLYPAFSPDGAHVVFRASRTGGRTSTPTTSTSKTHHEPDRTTTPADFAPGVLARRASGSTTPPSAARSRRSSASTPRPRTRASRSPTATGTTRTRRSPPTASGSSSRPTATRASTTSTRSTSRPARRCMHTNVVAGVFSPTVFIGKDNTEKLVFSAYYKRRFTLYIADAKKPFKRLAELAPVASPVGPGGVAPYQPAIEVSVDPEKVAAKTVARSSTSRTRRSSPASTPTRPSSPTPSSSSATTSATAASSRSSSRSRPSRTSTSPTSTSPSASRRASRSSTTGRTSSRSTRRTGRTQIVRDRRAYRETGRVLPRPAIPLVRYHRLEGQRRLHLARARLPVRRSRTTTGPRRSSSRRRTDNYPDRSALAFVGDTSLYQEWGPLSGRRYRFGVLLGAGLQEGRRSTRHGRARRRPTLTQDVSRRPAPLLQDHGALAHRGARSSARARRATSRTSTTSAASTRCAASTSASRSATRSATPTSSSASR